MLTRLSNVTTEATSVQILPSFKFISLDVCSFRSVVLATTGLQMLTPSYGRCDVVDLDPKSFCPAYREYSA